MQMEDNNIEALGKNLREYMKVQYELLKLQLVHKLSASISWLMSAMVIMLIAFLSVLFLSAAAGVYFANVLGSYTAGFSVVGLIYLFIFFILILFRKNIIATPLKNKIIEEALNESED